MTEHDDDDLVVQFSGHLRQKMMMTSESSLLAIYDKR
jgi:hypothetical protein